MANEFTLQDSGFFNEPSGFSFLQDPATAQQFSLFGQPFEGNLLSDPSFTSGLDFDIGGIGEGIGLDMLFDTKTGQVVSRAEAEALSNEDATSTSDVLRDRQAGIPSSQAPQPGIGSKLMELFKENPLMGLMLLMTGGLGLAGVGQQLAGGGGKQVTQKTEVGQTPRTPLEENLLSLVNQVLMSGGTGVPSLAGVPSLGGGVAPGGFTAPSSGASSAVLNALTGPRQAGPSPGNYRQSLLKLVGA